MTESQNLVVRLLAAPDLARVVPQLAPRVLNQLIDRCGLEACVEIVMLATPRQLQRVLDTDLWRVAAVGADATLDGDRFAEWLEVLLDAGPTVAVDRLAAMDLDLVAGGFADHVRVFDGGAVAPYISLDGELMAHYERRGDLVCPIGGFVVEARRPAAWHVIVDALGALHAERPALFGRIMRTCVALSHGERERDGCDELPEDRDQQMADLAIERETRREQEGYVAPAQARAFLQAARELPLSGPQPGVDAIARACLAVAGAASEDGGPGAEDEGRDAEHADRGDEVAGGVVMELLVEAGIVAPPRARLAAGVPHEDRLGRVQQFIEMHPAAPDELAFLANVLLGGSALHGRPFTAAEAAEAVLATCNLGLENLPAAWQARDLVVAFQTGWAVMHRDLCRHAARVLIRVLDEIRLSDRDAQWSLETLRRELTRHLADGEPWRARQALDAILMLDPPAWAVPRALLAECPALHVLLTPGGRGALKVDPDDVSFAATTDEIGLAWEYLGTLGSTLAGW